MAHTLSISYDDTILFETSLTRVEFEQGAHFLLAAKLFEMGRLPSGKAAQLCGKQRVQFLLSLQRIGISMNNLGPEDADDEIAFAARR